MSELFGLLAIAAAVLLGAGGVAWLADLPAARDWLGDEDPTDDD